MGKGIKRTFLVLGIVFGLLLATLILAPFLFKDKIMALVKTELNKQLNAVTDFSDVDISLIRSFPQLSVSVRDLSIANLAPFEGDTLVSARSIDLTLDLMKAINGEYDIRKIAVVRPRIHALVNAAGEANWNITHADTTTTIDTSAPAPFALKLQKYSIEDAYILYHDAKSGMMAELRDLDHSGSGDFSRDLFTLRTKTRIEALTFIYGKVPYLNRVKTILNINLDVDTKSNRYTFNTEDIQLNGLKLSTEGFVQLPTGGDPDMYIKFSTPSNDFKDILSLVPGIYQNNFSDIKTTGKLALNGYVKGVMSENKTPSYQVNLSIDNGSFRYPDLPQAVTDIQIKLQAHNPDGVTDHTVINLEKGHINFGGAPFDFRLLVKTPVSNPWIDAAAKGRLDLSQVQQFVKLEEGTKLTGIINADMAVRGAISAAEKKQFDKIDASGSIDISNLLYASKDYPEGVKLNSLGLTFNPKNVTVSNLSGAYLQTNFTGNGYINNLLNYYLNNDPLDGTINIAVDNLDVNKWMGTESATESANKESAPASGASQVFIVPANLNITLNAKAGKVIYDNLVLTDVRGTLAIRNETVYLQGVSGKGLDGTIQIDGSYSTKQDKRNPDIQLSYKLQGLDIQKTFATFNTVEKLMPAGKYMSGKMSSQLTMKGKLDQQMSPVMNSLSGKGDLLLIDGVLSKFAPLEQLAGKLHIKQLEKISLKDIKNYFSFENGRVTVEPFRFQTQNISVEAGGSHGFDQTLKYGLNLVVPRSALGSQGNAMVNSLVNQAASKGVPVKVGETINLAVQIGGTISKPEISTNLKESASNAVEDLKKQVEEEVKAKVDSVKTVVKDTVKAIRDKAVEDAKKEAQKELQRQLSGKKDSTTAKPDLNKAGKEAEEKAKGALKGLLKKK
jgi:uncharacterized protein involved in outer membrane biogenesis